MPKVIIIPHNQIEKVCQDAMSFANSCQSDFTFYVLPPTNTPNAILHGHKAEALDVLKYLDEQRVTNGYDKDDLMIAFYNGILQVSSHGLSNLFCAGSRHDEDYPCTAVISLKYLDWEVLEEKYNYEVQKHSILHLIICGITGAYTHLHAHSDIGCLLDMNLSLSSFNLKLRKGYYFCSANEFGCYDQMQKEKYGKAILRLCDRFKEGNYQNVINELILGDKIQVGNIANNSGQILIGKGLKITNAQATQNSND